jgi:hypothetical protein
MRKSLGALVVGVHVERTLLAVFQFLKPFTLCCVQGNLSKFQIGIWDMGHPVLTVIVLRSTLEGSAGARTSFARTRAELTSFVRGFVSGAEPSTKRGFSTSDA